MGGLALQLPWFPMLFTSQEGRYIVIPAIVKTIPQTFVTSFSYAANTTSWGISVILPLWILVIPLVATNTRWVFYINTHSHELTAVTVFHAMKTMVYHPRSTTRSVIQCGRYHTLMLLHDKDSNWLWPWMVGITTILKKTSLALPVGISSNRRSCGLLMALSPSKLSWLRRLTILCILLVWMMQCWKSKQNITGKVCHWYCHSCFPTTIKLVHHLINMLVGWYCLVDTPASWMTKIRMVYHKQVPTIINPVSTKSHQV